MPAANPDDNPACTLLTKKERSDLVGYSMDAVVPVQPEPGTVECVWVRSLRHPARAAIRVVAFSTPVWSRQIVPQLRTAINSPTTDKALAAKLDDALNDLLANPAGFSSERACETYVLLAESRGASLDTGEIGFATIGAMPAAFGISCENGILTRAGYGEYGIRPSPALFRGVSKLVDAASERAPEVLGTSESNRRDAADGPGSPEPRARAETAEESPSPEPVPNAPDEPDAEDEDES